MVIDEALLIVAEEGEGTTTLQAEPSTFEAFL